MDELSPDLSDVVDDSNCSGMSGVLGEKGFAGAQGGRFMGYEASDAESSKERCFLWMLPKSLLITMTVRSFHPVSHLVK